MSLTIIAQITAASGKEDLVRAELEKLVAPTRAEDGCLCYDLHVDNTNPGFFVFHETWETAAALDSHRTAPQLASFREATKGAISAFTVNELTKIA